MRYDSTRIGTGRSERVCRPSKPRRGAIIVLTAFLMVILMALLALSIDTGYMYTMQTELDRSVDAAALAGAASLVDGTQVASDKVVEYLVRNPVGDSNGTVSETQLPALTTQFLADHQNDLQVVLGNWNSTTNQLVPDSQLPSALSVSVQYPNLPLFFGRVLGKDSFSLQAEAVAMFQPRDIMLVLDFSGSMNDDSELKSIGTFGYSAILANLQQMYTELGSPVYGNLQFDPQYITVAGIPPVDPAQDPQITVEYRYRSAYVTSTKDISNVQLEFDNGNTEKFDNLSGLTGTFAGTGDNANKPIERVWVKSANNGDGTGGGLGELFDFDHHTIDSTIQTALGLDGVNYPYPAGSWHDYFSYAKSGSTNVNAGFEYKFGFANLINYWLERYPENSQTPDLWKVSAQPVTSVKDAVDVFISYVQQVDTNDRLGLVVYDALDGEATVETSLTTDLALAGNLARHRQAGHYHRYTNIGAGLRSARLELQQNGRQGAFKMIVLMTDGRANWYAGGYDTTAARNDVLQEASASAGLKYPVITISLGAGADIDLMTQVATITDARTFNVPGGQAVAEYRDALFQVFREIAAHRPLKLVH